MLLVAWLPAALITLLHYLSGPQLHWLHDILRRLYYLPILLAAFSLGLRGGLTLAVAVAVAYSPHAFTHLVQTDPAHTLEKVLELLLYGVVGGVAGVLVDRERRRHEQLRQALHEQQRTADQLVRAGRLAALGELVAGIAHELKNPLHALQGTAEVVDGVVPAEAGQRRLWELHRKEIDRLGQVAERFLSFARPSPPERRELDLTQVIERTRGLVAAQARGQSVELVVDPPPADCVCTALADEQQLTQVLLNITLNALQSIGEGGGTVRFGLDTVRRGEQDYRVLTVSNDGPQIPEPDLERIFDPFVTTKSEGAGLGLSIAARIVEGHAGFIEVQNLRGSGVAFAVLLPG
jgi:signal transduction histidine kinase